MGGALISLGIALGIVVSVWLIVCGIVLLVTEWAYGVPVTRYRIRRFVGTILALVQVRLVRALAWVRRNIGVRIKRMGERGSPANGLHLFVLTPWATVGFTVSWMAR